MFPLSRGVCCATRSSSRFFHSSSPSLVSIENFDVFKNKQAEVCLDGYNSDGFQIDECDVYYSLFILPHTSYLWNVSCMKDITPESLSILEIIKPIDLLLVGSGKYIEPLPLAVTEYLQEIGIDMIEFQSTECAVGTFNVLNQEGRNFATLLLPKNPEMMFTIPKGEHVTKTQVTQSNSSRYADLYQRKE